MIGISCDPSGLRRQVNQTLKLFDYIQVQANALANYFHPIVQERTPKKTGETAKSWTIHFHRIVDGGGWEISPDGREDIVTFLEFGTKPHVIVPKRIDGVLAFEIGGEMVFAKEVFHPGTKPLGFVRQTQDDVDEAALGLANRLLRTIRSIWG